MKRSNIQRTLKYGIGIFISVLALSAGLAGSHHALAAQGSSKLGVNCIPYTGAIITSRDDGKILTAHRSPRRTGSFVDVETTNDRDNQRWNFVPVNSIVPNNVGGSACAYKIISLRTGKVLTAENYGVTLSDDTGNANQLWDITLTPNSYSHIGFGYTESYRNIYKIVSFRNEALDVFGASTAEGAPVVLAANNDGPGHAQNWYIGPYLLTGPGIPSFPQGPINPSFPQGPINPSFPQGPINPSFPQGPINSGFPQGPINPSFPQGPINSGFPQGPINSGFPQGPINSGFPQGPISSGFPQGSINLGFLR